MSPIQETFRKPLSRRALLGAAAGVALLPFAVSGGTARAGRRVTPAPLTVDLPLGFRPEGIASGPGTTYYAGSMANGSIVTGDLTTGSQSVLLGPEPGRAFRGLYYDGRSGLLWAAGNVGADQYVWAIYASNGSVLYSETVVGGGFHNDVVVTKGRVFLTDSRNDWLVVVPLDDDALPDGSAGTLALAGAWPTSPPGTTNANGIRELSDGSLVLNNSRVGGLWQVDPDTGETVQIPIRGGKPVTGGDGLVLDGSYLYDVRATGQNEVAVFLMQQTGTGWRASWRGIVAAPTLDVPSTATIAGGWLWAVNARFGVPNPGAASYWISRLPARNA
jgi:hypothetical protein